MTDLSQNSLSPGEQVLGAMAGRLPATITAAGERASRQFIEFFVANIRNRNTREAFARPSTAKGVTFVTLEDKTGAANLLIHPKTWEKFYQTARNSNAWIVTGRLEPTRVKIVLCSAIDMSWYLEQSECC